MMIMGTNACIGSANNITEDIITYYYLVAAKRSQWTYHIMTCRHTTNGTTNSPFATYMWQMMDILGHQYIYSHSIGYCHAVTYMIGNGTEQTYDTSQFTFG